MTNLGYLEINYSLICFVDKHFNYKINPQSQLIDEDEKPVIFHSWIQSRTTEKKIPLRTENKRISINHSQCGCRFISAACYLFVGTDGHIVCIIFVMKEKSKIHGKPCTGIWVKFCELGIVLVPSFTQGQQDSLFCSCTNERNEPSCQLCSLHIV